MNVKVIKVFAFIESLRDEKIAEERKKKNSFSLIYHNENTELQ